MNARYVLNLIEATIKERAARAPGRVFLPVSDSALAPRPARPESPGALVAAITGSGELTPPAITALRVALGLTRGELGALLGAEEQRMARIERGTSKPTGLEVEVLMLFQHAVAPMVNLADARRWALGLIEIAETRGKLTALFELLSHVAARSET